MVCAPELMAECIARLEETAYQTLKVQITAAGLYRYRLEGIVRALLHILRQLFHSLQRFQHLLMNPNISRDDTLAFDHFRPL